jgi:hypothetical protein
MRQLWNRSLRSIRSLAGRPLRDLREPTPLRPTSAPTTRAWTPDERRQNRPYLGAVRFANEKHDELARVTLEIRRLIDTAGDRSDDPLQ